MFFCSFKYKLNTYTDTMKLSQITLKGFRNFKNATINFNEKTLIIGANDVGKTNLFHAIRLLLDRGFSDYDMEPLDSDFYAFEETHEFEIFLYFEDVIEECVLSKLKEKISDEKKLILAYKGYRDKTTRAKTYKFFGGPDIDTLEEFQDRYYRKVLNVKYISSRRDFHNYISKEKNYLFQAAKKNRNTKEIEDDELLYSIIQNDLGEIDNKIPQLNFISSATSKINEELLKLSLHHGKQKVVFDAMTSNVDSFISHVSIASKSNGQNVLIGGDGRLNQIYLALWASRNELTEENVKEVTIFCIEEPEAHLHPHQQRKLADYLNDVLKGQVLISTHSPQIASEFSPNSIIRLYNKDNMSIAASEGCSEIISESFEHFGYRMSIIPAEAFFSDVVYLVEGASEELFYKAMAKQIGIDLDRLNISILTVEGVGFEVFINILNSLEIDWVLRTDCDISKIPHKPEYRFAGVERCISFYRNSYHKDVETEKILKKHEQNLRGFISSNPNQENQDACDAITINMEGYYMFLSKKDLEHDIYDALENELKVLFPKKDRSGFITAMQKKKAVNMYNLLKKKLDLLAGLKKSDLAKPLLACEKLSKYIQDGSN